MKFAAVLIFLIFSFLALPERAACQFRPGAGGGGGFPQFPGGGTGGGGGSLGEVTLDTSDIFYFFSGNLNQIHPFSDSLLGGFQQFDPIRRQPYDFAHLNNLGSAHRPLFFQPAWRRGFDVGLHQFDLYQLENQDVRFYKITQAYTQALYSQGSSQSDALFDIKFSRNFAKGLNLSLEHRRINNAGAFDNNRALNSSVAAGLWLQGSGGRYDGFFTFTTNSIQQEDNGGIAESLADTLLPPFQLDVKLSTASTRYANREFSLTQYFRLSKKKAKPAAPASLTPPNLLKGGQTPHADTLRSAGKIPPAPGGRPGQKQPPAQNPAAAPPQNSVPPGQATGLQPPVQQPIPNFAKPELPPAPPKRTFTIFHQIAWRTASYRFSDPAPDTAFYQNFLVDSRGLRHFLETKKLENTFKLQTFKLRQTGDGGRQTVDGGRQTVDGGRQTVDGGRETGDGGRETGGESDLLEVGLVHAVHFIDQEPVDTQALHNLFLTGRLNFAVKERLQFQTYAHLGISPFRGSGGAGDYRVGGELFLNFRKLGNLRAAVVNQLYSPSLLQHRLFVSQREVWKNDFQRTLETSLSGTYSLPGFHFSVSGQYHLVSNLVYFDTSAMPRQSGAFSVVQLMVRKDFHLSPLHFENWLGLQEVTSEVLPLPRFYSKHSLYFEGKIFKKAMLARLGVDARLASGYSPPAYQPLTGQFFLQNGQALPFTPLLDAFLSFKVKTFRFFFKVENVLPFLTEAYYFQSPDYPLAYGLGNGGLRMGISWRLVD